jgi:hypothetical protein
VQLGVIKSLQRTTLAELVSFQQQQPIARPSADSLLETSPHG